MQKIELDIVALHHSVGQSPNYALVLGEVEGERRLPIVIGAFEAQAIVVAMENMTPNRPLTHDLFKNTLETFGVELQEVVINNLLDGIFYARLVCLKDGEKVEIDSRTSDAVAMAVRFDCPIYTFEFILEAAGISHESVAEEEEKQKTTVKKKPTTYDKMSIPDLEKLLDEMLTRENYEEAAKIRDEINSRKSQDD